MSTMTRFLAFFIAVLFPLTLPASAEVRGETGDAPVLIELFASQNCQACPKAHRTLKAVSERDPNLFVLTWSVNYWDYLGNPDPMAIPAAKKRQDAYADSLSLRAPYTPQSIYDGVKQCSGANKRAVLRSIKARRADDRSEAPLAILSEGRLDLPNGCVEPLDVQLVTYLPDDAHDTDMINPVVSTKILGSCSRDDASFAIACEGMCAILLQKPDHGEVVSTLKVN